MSSFRPSARTPCNHSSPAFWFCTSPTLWPFNTALTASLPGRTIVGGRCVRGGSSEAACERAFCCRTALTGQPLLGPSVALSAAGCRTPNGQVSRVRQARKVRAMRGPSEKGRTDSLHDHQSGHRLHDGHGAGHNARVVPALGLEHAGRAVIARGRLRLADSCGRLERDPDKSQLDEPDRRSPRASPAAD